MIRRAMTILGLLGLAVSVYIAAAVALFGSPQCLGGSGGCKTVENSIYSHLAGAPVSWFGIGGYAAIVVTLVWNRRWAPSAALLLTTIGFGFSLYLTYLELFVIFAICQWCVASAVIMTVLFVLSIRWWLTAELIVDGDSDLPAENRDPSKAFDTSTDHGPDFEPGSKSDGQLGQSS